MRLGTKILVLTLALVVTLTTVVVFLVGRQVESQERSRVTSEIHRSVSAYFARVDAAAENTLRAARLIFGEQFTRSDLSNLNNPDAMDGKQRAALELRISNDLFGLVLQRELEIGLLSGRKVAPAFHALFNAAGERLLLAAPGQPKLESALGDGRVVWKTGEVIPDDGASRSTTQYVLADSRLFLAIGVPVSTSAREDEPPTNSYFIGYEVDGAWAEGFVSTGEHAETEIGVWFVWYQGGTARPVVVKGGDTRLFADPLRCIHAVKRTGSDVSVGHPPVARRIEGENETYLAEVATFDVSLPQPNMPISYSPLVLAVTASLDRALAPMNRLLRTITLVGVGAVVLAFVACRFIASRIARPVRALVKSADDIGAGRFDVHLDTARKDEIGDLARGFEHMAQGLAQRDFIKDTFGKFVDPSVVSGLIADPQRLRPGGEQRVQTVLMSDIEGFTALSEKLRPEQVVELLNAYLGDAADIVTAERGVVDKFIGDAVVAFWGPPLTEDHAVRAARAAVKMVEAAAALKGRCESMGVPALRVRIGIATGEVLVGNIGSASKFNYTVMGDTVNLCARLEGLNKVFGTAVLCEERAAEAIGGEFLVREIDVVRVVGRGAPTRVFEVMREGPGDAGAVERCRLFAAARGLMMGRDFVGAAAAFGALVEKEGERGAAAALGRRCAGYAANPPGVEWDGVYEADRK